MNLKRGFTLLELIITITIIGVVSVSFYLLLHNLIDKNNKITYVQGTLYDDVIFFGQINDFIKNGDYLRFEYNGETVETSDIFLLYNLRDSNLTKRIQFHLNENIIINGITYDYQVTNINYDGENQLLKLVINNQIGNKKTIFLRGVNA